MAALAACLAIASCFEDPVPEKIAVRITDEGHAEITHQVTFNDRDSNDNKAFPARMESLRGDYLRQTDRWSILLAQVSPMQERLEWTREGGRLKAVKDTAIVNAATLQTLFGRLGASLTMSKDERWEELSIYGAAGQTATREQRQEVNVTLDRWALSIARYVEATRAVYEYLEANPSRAEACMGQLFQRNLGEEGRKALPPLTAAEEPLLLRVEETINEPTEILALPDDAAFTLNELSMLVYDPFGADLSFTVPAEILESEGFTSRNDRTVARPRVTLWSAYEALEGNWLSPDPLITWIRRDRAGENEPLPLASILGQKRSFARTISAAEVRKALEKELAFPATLRVRWRRGPSPEASSASR
jgi:hypothetical protein